MRPEKPWERARRTNHGETNDPDVRQASGAAASPSQVPLAEPVTRGTGDPYANAYATSNYDGYGAGYGSNGGYGGGYGGYGGYGGGYGGYGGGYGGYGGGYGGYGGGYGGYGGGYGGYGGMQGGGYNGMYGRGPYGFGNAAPGPSYGYGSPPGGSSGPGDGPPGNSQGPSGPAGMYHSAMRTLHSVVNFFGRIAYLVDQNTIALHMFIEALLNLLDRAGWLYGEMARFVLRILGFQPKDRKGGAGTRNGDQRPDAGTRSQPLGGSQGSWNVVWDSTPSRGQ